MNTPCEDRIDMAVRARARAILRRWFSAHQMCRVTADEHRWLKHNLPEVVTDTSLERALRLAGPEFSHACGLFVSNFYEPEAAGDVRAAVLIVLAKDEEASHA